MTVYEPLAIIMTICNDFKKESAESVTSQFYSGDLKIYFLDDSTKDDVKQEIDQFCLEHPQVILIRRVVKKDFKAGNLNNALFNHIKEPYFIQVDADQMVPPGFAAGLYEKLASLPSDVWFVQCAHYQNPQTGFAYDIGPSLSYMWKIFLRLKNVLGFVPNFGHGVIFRREVFESIGGYLPLVAEDLTISAIARMHGYRGYYETGIASGEDFPESYEAYHKQQFKYVTGAVEFFHKIFWSFIKSSNVSLLEKIDVAVSYSYNLLPALVLLYIFFSTIILPAVSAELVMLTIAPGITLPFLVPDAANRLLCTAFYLITLIMLVAPMLPAALDIFKKHGLITFRMLILCTPIYISRMVPCLMSILKYILFKDAEFITTGDTSKLDDSSFKTGETGRSWGKHISDTLHKMLDIRGENVYRIKLVTGLLLAFFSIRTLNFIIMSYAMSLIISYLIHHFGWENKIIRVLCYFPFFILIFSLVIWGVLEFI
ncbi:MAG: glycosyltransferase [Bacillota bacterium]|nr:glycosyltransferase [Bacillota bacterium]